ncbi:MAG: M12 family metallopeptidase [Acidimicrobiia bacterium]
MADEIRTSQESVASTDVRTGFLSGPGFVDVPVRYSVVDGIAIFDGCIDMGPVEEVERHADKVRGRLAAAAAQAAAGPPVADGPDIAMGVGLPSSSSFLWTNCTVPFVVDASVPNQARITQAIAHIEANSPIRFVARTNHANYVRFVPNPGQTFSSSAVGMRGGEQLIRLADGHPWGVVVHECLHALGILHEQSRCDRDRYVKINYQNIQSGFESNFDKFCEGYTDYADYDYGSIMHYHGTAFSKNDQPTIVPLQSGVTIGQRSALSFNDRVTIAQMYSRFTGSGHTGVWRAGAGKYALWVNANWQSFHAKWQEWAQQGLRLVDISVRRVGNEDRYSGVWLPGTGGYALWVNASFDSFVAKWKEWAQQGLRLVDVHVRRVGNQDLYSGVWLPGTGGYGLWANASWDSFRAKWQEWAQQGLRLVDVDVRQVGGQTRYTGVWLPGTGGYALWVNASFASFVSKWKEFSGQGLRLVDVSVHQEGGADRYSGAFLPGTDGYYLWANVPWESLRARWEQLAAQGLRLVDYEFTEAAAADALDFAGTPAAALADAGPPEEAGGIFGEDGAPAEMVPAGVLAEGDAGGDGQGGAEVGGPGQPVTAADGAGMGEAVLAGSSGAAPASAADGMGGVVADPAGPASSTPGGDGMGGAVAAPAASTANGTPALAMEG